MIFLIAKVVAVVVIILVSTEMYYTGKENII